MCSKSLRCCEGDILKVVILRMTFSNRDWPSHWDRNTFPFSSSTNIVHELNVPELSWVFIIIIILRWVFHRLFHFVAVKQYGSFFAHCWCCSLIIALACFSPMDDKRNYTSHLGPGSRQEHQKHISNQLLVANLMTSLDIESQISWIAITLPLD